LPPPLPVAPLRVLPPSVSLLALVRELPLSASPPLARLPLALPPTPRPAARPEVPLVDVRPPSASLLKRLRALPLSPPAPPAESGVPEPPAPPAPLVAVCVPVALVAPPVAAPEVAAPLVWLPGVAAPPVPVRVAAPPVPAPEVDAPDVFAPPVVAPPVAAPPVAVREAAPPVWLTAPFCMTAPIGLLIDRLLDAPAVAPPVLTDCVTGP